MGVSSLDLGRRSVIDWVDTRPAQGEAFTPAAEKYAIDARIASEGLEALVARSFGDRARVRRFEIAAALNRLRSLRLVAPVDPSLR